MIANDWFDNFSTGDDALDSERRVLFEMLDAYCQKASMERSNPNLLAMFVDVIGARLLDHVDHLDERMDSADPSIRDSHVRARADLFDLINDYRSECDRHPETFDIARFAEDMRAWLRAQVLTAHLAFASDIGAVDSRA